MSFRARCLLLLVLTSALWSTSGVLVKSIDWNPAAIASSRSLVAGLTIAFLARKTCPPRALAAPSRLNLLGGALLALLGFTFVISTKLTTAANAILLQYTAPIWVAMAAPLVLKERTRALDWLFIALTLAGMGLFFMDSLSAEGFWGIVIAIFGSFFFGGVAMVMRFQKGDGPPMAMLVYGNAMAFLLGLWFWQPPWPAPRDVAFIVFLGVFQFGLPYYLFSLASRGVSSLEMVLLTTLEPILNPVWVFLALGEKPGFWALVGGGVVLGSVTLWSVLKTLRKPAAA